MQVPPESRLLINPRSAEDAAVYQLRPDLAVIHTVDVFTPVVDDPYLFGQIAAANSLSDIYAMGGRPILALNVLAFHQGKVSHDTVKQILTGARDKVLEAGAVIAGGHSIQDLEIKYGLAVVGEIQPQKVWRKDTLQQDDVLVLTKPLGTGAISTALKHEKAAPGDLEEIIVSMKLLHDVPVRILNDGGYSVHACTDITGFGLAVHALEMLGDDGLDLSLDLAQLPRFSGLEKYLYEPAFLPGGFYANRFFFADRTGAGAKWDEERYNILFDPQTSGGLLIALSQDEAERFIREMAGTGYPYTPVIIGRISKGQGKVHILS